MEAPLEVMEASDTLMEVFMKVVEGLEASTNVSREAYLQASNLRLTPLSWDFTFKLEKLTLILP